MKPADLNALLAEPQVAAQRSGLIVFFCSGGHLADEECPITRRVDALATAIAEAVERRFAPLVTAHAEWVAAWEALGAIPLKSDGSDTADIVAIVRREGKAKDALAALAPLTDRKETTG